LLNSPRDSGAAFYAAGRRGDLSIRVILVAISHRQIWRVRRIVIFDDAAGIAKGVSRRQPFDYQFDKMASRRHIRC
jgi:hypothetical protein